MLTRTWTLRRALRQLTLPPEAALAVAARSVQAVWMLLAVIVAARSMNEDELGHFYVFLSLAALLQLTDFGINYAAMQAASHLPGGDRGRLRSLTRAAVVRQRPVTAVLVAAVGLLGAFVFSTSSTTEDAVGWLPPWLGLLVAAAAAQAVNLRIALVEGGESPAKAWFARAMQEAFGGAAFVGLLALGAGLWSVAAYVAARASVGYVAWLASSRASSTASGSHEATVEVDWGREVWPFQWKIGVSALCGFLIFQSLSPVVMIESGSSAAAEVGICLAMMNTVLMLTSVWPLSQAARYGCCIRERDHARLALLFRATTLYSTLFAVATSLGVYGLVFLLPRIGLHIGIPQSGHLMLGIFLLAAVLHHVVICFAVLLRARQQDPLLLASVLGGALTVVAVWLAARWGSSREVAMIYSACVATGVPIAYLYYRGLGLSTADTPRQSA